MEQTKKSVKGERVYDLLCLVWFSGRTRLYTTRLFGPMVRLDPHDCLTSRAWVDSPTRQVGRRRPEGYLCRAWGRAKYVPMSHARSSRERWVWTYINRVLLMFVESKGKMRKKKKVWVTRRRERVWTWSLAHCVANLDAVGRPRVRFSFGTVPAGKLHCFHSATTASLWVTVCSSIYYSSSNLNSARVQIQCRYSRPLSLYHYRLCCLCLACVWFSLQHMLHCRHGSDSADRRSDSPHTCWPRPREVREIQKMFVYLWVQMPGYVPKPLHISRRLLLCFN